MDSIKPYETRCLSTIFSDITVYTFPMKVKDVVSIHYVAVRGRDKEEAAVQRVLNKRRIGAIKGFVLQGNMFFNTFILNWTDSSYRPQPDGDKITIPVSKHAAQVIDGQHRLAGLEAAMQHDPSIGEQQILVSLSIGLSTKQAALIFLNINSEQRPAPRSLIYDLFGEIEDDADHVINRANDIAKELNENPDSPFHNAIKYPGAPRTIGAIDLSTVVSSLKGHLTPEGIFAKVNLRSLNYQETVLLNYFEAIKSYYDKQGLLYNKAKNPFFRSAGFTGAIEHLTSTLLMKCADKKSFSKDTFQEFLALDRDSLLVHDEIKGLDGKTARRKIKEYLESHLLDALPEQDQYEF
jgi:DNA sulfur modification protein DndB